MPMFAPPNVAEAKENPIRNKEADCKEIAEPGLVLYKENQVPPLDLTMSQMTLEDKVDAILVLVWEIAKNQKGNLKICE